MIEIVELSLISLIVFKILPGSLNVPLNVQKKCLKYCVQSLKMIGPKINLYYLYNAFILFILYSKHINVKMILTDK